MTTRTISAAELAAQPALFERQRAGEVRITSKDAQLFGLNTETANGFWFNTDSKGFISVHVTHYMPITITELRPAAPETRSCPHTTNGAICSETERFADVLALRHQHATTWRDKPERYWLARLMQEVGELGSSLVGDHDDPPEHELRQIAAIAMNWLDMRRQAIGGAGLPESEGGDDE